MFIAEHNLPLKILDHLPQLIKSICPESAIAKSIHCSRRKGIDYAKQVFAPEKLSIITQDLQESFETTDVSIKKNWQ